MSTGTVVTSPQDHWMIKVRQRGKLERKYRYLEEEKIFRPMKRFRSRKRSELNGVEKREEKKIFCGRGDGKCDLMGREGYVSQ